MSVIDFQWIMNNSNRCSEYVTDYNLCFAVTNLVNQCILMLLC